MAAAELSTSCTVAQYLKQRLEEVGCEHVFGVAGNYAAAFLNTIEEDAETCINISGNTNEINAGHCADGYARVSNGVAAVCVTYGVGAFSLLNPVAGSYVEHNRVVVINGAPGYAEQKRQRAEGLLYSHMTGDEKSNINAYRDVTVAAEQIRNASQAPGKIDAVLAACVAEGRPAYLEVYEDVWRQTCSAPSAPLTICAHVGCASEAMAAVKATMEMIVEKGRPLFWGGIEINRKNLQSEFQHLITSSNSPYMTTILAKSLLTESHEMFRGVYNGNATPEIIKQHFLDAGCRIGIGVWNTSKNLGGTNPWDNASVMANSEGVSVGNRYFPNVSLADYIAGLTDAICGPTFARYELPKFDVFTDCVLKDKPVSESSLAYDTFFHVIDSYLRDEHIVVVDAGFPLLGAQNLHINCQDGFVSAAAWLSIGYSVPASLGVKFAAGNKRPLVFVGDGAFQETCQEVSGHHHYGTNNVVFVLNNSIYGIEQLLVNPNPFRPQDSEDAKIRKRDYKDPLLNRVYPYNELNAWNYEKIVDMVGGTGFVVESLAQLHETLRRIDEMPEENIVVHVKLPRTDVPNAISYKFAGTGEDEYQSPDFPPFCPPN